MAGVKQMGGSYDNSGTITGYSYGIEIYGATATVTNSGSVTATQTSGIGVELMDGGTVNNDFGGKIAGGYRGLGVEIFGGAGIVTNSGSITAGGNSAICVELLAGGTVTNEQGGTISGPEGISIGGGAGAVSNAGAISGYGAGRGPAIGVALGDGGTVANEQGGTISGIGVFGGLGVAIGGAEGMVSNAGTIAGGVSLSEGGTVINSTGGTISETFYCVYIEGASGTVVNAGSITGAVKFAGSGTNTLTLQTGSSLGADAIGSTATGATNALVLQGTGTADNNFENFNTLEVQASGDWTLGGDDAIGATMVSSGTLVVTGDLTSPLTLESQGEAEFASNYQGDVTFEGVGGTLALSQAYGGTIAGFRPGDSIVLDSVRYAADDSLQFAANGSDDDLVSIHSISGALLGQFTFKGVYRAGDFALGKDADGDLVLVAPAEPTVAITNVGPLPDSANLTLIGTIDAADAGMTISIYDDETLVATTMANGAGVWSANLTITGTVQALTAEATGADGATGVSNVEYLATVAFEPINFPDASGDAASLYNTGGGNDVVNGSSGTVYLTAAHAHLFGGDDVIDFLGGSGDLVRLLNTDGDRDKVIGSDGKVKIVDSQARVVGDDDVIRLLGDSGDDVVKLVATGAGSDSVHGSDAKVVLIGANASVTGDDDTVRLRGNNSVTANGGSDAFVFQPTIGLNAINGFASTDSMQFSVSDFADWTALSGDISQSGANTVIKLDASDAVTLTNVTAASLISSQFHFA